MIRGGVLGLLTMLFGLSATAQDRVIYHFQRTDGPVADIVKSAIDVLVEMDPGSRCTAKQDLLFVITTNIYSPGQVEIQLEAGTGASFDFLAERALVGPEADPVNAVTSFMKRQAASEPIPDDTPVELLLEYGIPMLVESGDPEADLEECSAARKRWMAEHPDRYRSFREAYNSIEQ